MLKPKETTRKKPSMAALRRSVASSPPVETAKSTHHLEQKLGRPAEQRFAHIKLAA